MNENESEFEHLNLKEEPVDKVPAQRSRKNRVAGTMEMKPVLNVNAQYYQDWFF